MGTGTDVRSLGKSTPAWSSEYDIDLDWMVAHAERLGLDDAEGATDAATGAKIDVGDERDFPALPGAKSRDRPDKTSAVTASTPPAPQSRIPLFAPASSPFAAPPPPLVDTTTLAAKLAIQSLQAVFPVLSRHEIEQYYRRAGGSLEATRTLIQSATGHAPARTPAPNKTSPKPSGALQPASRERREVRGRCLGAALCCAVLCLLLKGHRARYRPVPGVGSNRRHRCVAV